MRSSRKEENLSVVSLSRTESGEAGDQEEESVVEWDGFRRVFRGPDNGPESAALFHRGICETGYRE